MSAENEKIKQAEAVIFACGDGISAAALARALDVDEKYLGVILDRLREKYGGEDSGVLLKKNGDLVSFVTAPETADTVYRALNTRKNSPLSNAAMETLAIVAYNQPVSRAFIEQVRGVDSSSSLRTLVNRGLVEEAGRLDIPGRPLAYRTTGVFLRSFSLDSIYRLPRVKPEEDGQTSLDDD